MNEILFAALLVSMLTLASIAFCAGRVFVFAYAATIGTISVFVAPIIVDILGFPISVGELFYAVLFLITDLVAEHHGRREARLIVWISILVMGTIAITTQLVCALVPHSFDVGMPHLVALMEVAPRILLASTVLFVAEQHFDIWLYVKLKRIFGPKRLWLRNNISTMTTQSLDVLIYYPLVFWGVYPSLANLMLTALALKSAMALLDTSFVYGVAIWLRRQALSHPPSVAGEDSKIACVEC